MGLFDGVLGSLLGGSANSGALQSILGSVLAGREGGGGGLPGIIGAFQQAGLGHVVNSWVGNGPNQPVDPNQLHQVFGQEQLNQWSQQTGMSQDSILSELSKMLPHAVDQATPGGQVPQGGGSPFDEPGLELPQR